MRLSGCGKSVTSLSIMKLLARNSKISNGEILLNGKDLLKEDKKGMRKIRGREVAMIFQEPMNSLNPCMRIEKQLTEAILLHNNFSKEEAHNRAFEVLKGLFTGDLGSSIKNGKTVVETIAPRLKPTIMLTFSSMIWAAIIGIAIGIIAAVFHGRILDYVGMIIAIAGISVPSFWLGLELIQLFSVSLGWLPTSGLETWKSYILPSLTMGAGIMAVLARFSRSSMLETMREDYVRTARAKGLSESLVVMRHAFKNSLIEIVTVAGLQIGGLLSGSVMAETVFSIPGLGRLLVDSIQMRDYKVVQALLLFFATEYILINLIVDVLYGVINPRVRYE